MEQRTLKRNRRGAKAEEWASWPPATVPPKESTKEDIRCYLEDSFRRQDLNDDWITKSPLDPILLQYEFLRLICLKLGLLVVILEDECNPSSCPEMKADQWLYLCAAHPTPQSCAAIDYIVHTLDGATALLNSHKHFPVDAPIPESSVKHFSNICRRLYRIFAHCYFQHPEEFTMLENETQLYRRFLSFSRAYELVPDSLIIIPEGEG